MLGDHLDLSSTPQGEGVPTSSGPGRKFVGVQFACCKVYARIYVNREGTSYTGNCPRCSRPIQLRIGPDGTNSRFFTAY